MILKKLNIIIFLVIVSLYQLQAGTHQPQYNCKVDPLTFMLVILCLIGSVIFLSIKLLKSRKKQQELEGELVQKTLQLNDTKSYLKRINRKHKKQGHHLAEISRELSQAHGKLEAKNKELDRSTKKLQHTDQKQLCFFANISHEIRTPLTLITGPLEKFLKKERLETADEWGNIYNHLQMIYKNAKKISRLVNEVIDFRKLDQGGVKVNKSNNNIIEIANEVVSAFQMQADSKGILLKVMSEELRVKSYETQKNTQFFTHHSSLITQFWFDPGVMEKIFYNLISNAIKFTPEGGEVSITIGVVVETRHALSLPNKQLVIKIADTGIGIFPHEINKIFDRFYRVESDEGITKDGTGIGLAYTKELVELHSGKIYVESKPGKGACFKLEFPIKDNHDGSIIDNKYLIHPSEKIMDSICIDEQLNTNKLRNNSNEHPKETNIEGDIVTKSEETILNHSILIVEDNIDLRFFIKSILGSEFTIFEAQNGEKGWQLAMEKSPDIIISDIRMPFMDGVTLCERIKNDEITSHIPVILLTARSGKDNMITGLKSGADDYITKPFNVEILKLKIYNILKFRDRLHRQFNNSIKIVPSEITNSSHDEEFMRKAIKLVNENLHEPDFNNDAFVGHMNYSRAVVYVKIKKLTGMTVSEFIRSLRLKAAARLFEDGHKNINDVCFKVGFKHYSILSRNFSKMFSMSPSQYIKEQQHQNE